MYSLKSIAKRFLGRISFTFLLVVIESLLDVLFPLFIGWAVNDLIENSYTGLFMLGSLGLLALLIGAARRFYDTRIYGGIYQTIAYEMVSQGKKVDTSVSKLSARSGLLTELVEFFEHSMPGIVFSLVGVVGTLIIIASLNLSIMFACLALLILMIITYWLTGNIQYDYHGHYNHILEQRVDVLSQNESQFIRKHFVDLMRWNIKLSDLETINFSVIWLGVIALFISAPLIAINSDSTVPEVGTLLAILIYIFDYSGKVVTLPLYIQQLIRLQEISQRLSNNDSTTNMT